MKGNFRFIIYSFFCVLFLLTQCRQDQPKKEFEFRIITDAITNSNTPYHVDITHYPVERSDLPIGVFDSGTGGLSVLNSILELDEFNNKTHEPGSDGIADFNSERFIYLADEANMPYGKYNGESKADFLQELVLKDVLFLLSNNYFLSPDDLSPQADKEPVKSIVIACNTATAYGLETVREAMDYWDLGVEITGIIEAGAKSALENLADRESQSSVIGILATEGTCASGGYPGSVQKIAAHLLPNKDIHVVQHAGIGLAGAIDGDINYIDPQATEVRNDAEYFGPGIGHTDYPIDLTLLKEYNFEDGAGLLERKDQDGITSVIQLNSVINYIRYMVTHLVKTVLEEYPDRTLNAVILGCTHYPYVEGEIKEHFLYLKQYDEKYAQIIPENIALIDPAKSLAMELYKELSRTNMWGEDHISNSRFFISVPNKRLPENQIDENGEFPYAWKYGRGLNTQKQYVKHVPFSDEWIDESIRMRIKENIPTTYDIMIKNFKP